MERVKLTPARIRDFTCPPDRSQAFLWDTDAPRLAVRATRGAKSYIFEAKLNRHTIRLTLGDTDSWVLNSVWSGKGDSRQEIQRGAREEASRLAALVNQGIDPRQLAAEHLARLQQAQADLTAATERQAAEAVHQALLVEHAWQAYLTERAPRWSAKHRQAHQGLAQGAEERHDRLTIPGPLAPLLPLRLVDLTAERLLVWQTTEAAARPGAAALAFRLLRAFLRWCGEQPAYQELVDPAALLTKRVREAVPAAKTKDDCLQKEQLKPWFAAVRQNTNPVIPAYLQILLLTGARREELANLTWANVDFPWKSLTIGDKVEGERIIPLTPYVAALLQDLKMRNETPPPVPRRLRSTPEADRPQWKPSPWVFPSKTAASGRLQEPRIFHNRALAAAGLPPLSLHGLRRSFGTLAEWTECPVGVVAQIMGHKPSALAEKHYRRRPLDLLRKWHTAIEGFILDAAGIEQSRALSFNQPPIT